MIQQPPLEPGAFGDVESRERLARLDQTKKVKRTVKRARVAGRCDHRRCKTIDVRRANEVALITDARQGIGPAEGGDQRRS
jgi:hypothetical protein